VSRLRFPSKLWKNAHIEGHRNAALRQVAIYDDGIVTSLAAEVISEGCMTSEALFHSIDQVLRAA
jgi:hypothetical protein